MDNLVQSGDPNDLFAFAINYNTVSNSNNFTSTPLFNGNISETYWKTSSDNRIRKYAYRYDNLNRLREAVYMRPETPSARGFYDESMWYDKNGNIMGLTRNGYLDADSGQGYEIDDLVYAYGANSNQLLFAEDKSNSWDGFKDGSNPTPERPDYDYDFNGNMTSDWNKGIEGITYNYLNLPVKITFKVDSGHKYIEYLYNAVGVKLGKRVFNDSPNSDAADSSVLYLGGFQYTGDDLQLFPTSEGYVSVTGTSYNYVFNYTDHLGNVRLGYTKDPVTGQLKVLEESHYYPYGMKHSNYGASSNDYARDEDNNVLYAIIKRVERGKYQYKYNGKELQDELGLNFYDYGARNYDPALGRWMNIDPLAEKSRRFNPYTYALNNPVYFIDPDGMMASPPDDHFDTAGNFLYTDNRKTNNIVIDLPQNNPATASNFEVKLSDYTFNKSNYSTLSKITEHYGNMVGMDMSSVKNGKISVGDITNVEKKGSYIEGQPAGYNGGEYKVDDTNGGRTLMYTALDKDMVVVNLFEGKVDSKLDNKYNFMSVIDHEGGPIGHLVNPDKKHSDIYTDQISKYGKLVSQDFLKNLQDNYKSYKKDGD